MARCCRIASFTWLVAERMLPKPSDYRSVFTEVPYQYLGDLTMKGLDMQMPNSASPSPLFVHTMLTGHFLCSTILPRKQVQYKNLHFILLTIIPY